MHDNNGHDNKYDYLMAFGCVNISIDYFSLSSHVLYVRRFMPVVCVRGPKRVVPHNTSLC